MAERRKGGKAERQKGRKAEGQKGRKAEEVKGAREAKDAEASGLTLSRSYALTFSHYLTLLKLGI